MHGLADKLQNLPERISGLREMAYNLWWSWHPEGRDLFKMLSRQAWYLSGHNPVKMLNHMDQGDMDDAARDPRFLRHYDSVMARFEADMDPHSGWFASKARGRNQTIAYFSAEYGLHHALPFYAGGLGFLAGDYLKECSDLGIPLIGVGFMYPQGYLRQRISPEGWQVGACELLDRENAPIRKVLDADGDPISVRLPILDPPLNIEVWKVAVGRTPLYLMDTSSDLNDPSSRCISDRLYTGDPESRLRQEIVLGIGGIRVLRALGIDFSAIHLNEGHPTFAVLERVREMVGMGMTFSEAREMVRRTTVFTTHTPVPAGHDVFPFSIMGRYFGAYLPQLEISRGDFLALGVDPKNPGRGFNMTAFALRSSAYRNAVSKKHGEVTREMWRSLWPGFSTEAVPIDYVTNGVHVPSWIDRTLGGDILSRYLGRDWLEAHDSPRIWELVDEIPDDVLWKHHMRMKNILITRIRERAREKWLDSGTADPRLVMASGVLLDPPALTLGFARRFASYKRPTLLLHDPERLKGIVNNLWMPVQIIFAGKAHQDDQFSKGLLQTVFRSAGDQGFGGRIAYVEDYDELLAQYMVHGTDVWANNPLPPMEASGTSGMKATLNGVPQLSILDGWWIEGYNGRNGWAVEGDEGEDRDARDAEAIYETLERQVVPLYYDVEDDGVPHGWVKMMKEAIKMTGPNFCARRMAKEYTYKFYKGALEASQATAPGVRYRAPDPFSKI